MEKIPNSRYPEQLDRLIDEENNVTCNDISVAGSLRVQGQPVGGGLKLYNHHITFNYHPTYGGRTIDIVSISDEVITMSNLSQAHKKIIAVLDSTALHIAQIGIDTFAIISLQVDASVSLTKVAISNIESDIVTEIKN